LLHWYFLGRHEGAYWFFLCFHGNW
jgi:hypothetical protein